MVKDNKLRIQNLFTVTVDDICIGVYQPKKNILSM